MDTALADGAVVMAPPVLSELLTDPALPPDVERELLTIPLMELLPDYWVRAGKLRSDLRNRGYKAKLVDTLIAQCCIDHDVQLLTRDRDFRTADSFCSRDRQPHRISSNTSATPGPQILGAQAFLREFAPFLAGMFAAVRGEMAVVGIFVG
jgi:predicted nucleic acid-binding protein